MPKGIVIKDLGLAPFEPTAQAMREFTNTRGPRTPDECWLLEHPPVFTLGQAAKPEHLLAPGNTPIVQTDRGGQVTWHGPGQLVAYLLLDLRRAQINLSALVHGIERSIIRLLADWDLKGETRPGAPGVYIAGAKIAALGLRIRRGRSYHGLSLNICNDLAPFRAINPCGYPGLSVASLESLGAPADLQAAKPQLAHHLAAEFGYTLNWSEADDEPQPLCPARQGQAAEPASRGAQPTASRTRPLQAPQPQPANPAPAPRMRQHG